MYGCTPAGGSKESVQVIPAHASTTLKWHKEREASVGSIVHRIERSDGSH